MNRTKAVLAVGLGLIALLLTAPLANAKQAKHEKGPLPDLVVGKVSKPPASVVVGSEITISVKLRNKGKAKARKSKAGLYLAKGKKLTHKDRRLEQAKVKALRSHKKAKAKFKVVLPAKTAPGTYRLIACADDKKSLHESKEKDNCRASKQFKLTPLPSPAPQPGPAKPAFTMTDGLDWGFVEDADEKSPGPGDPVTATLTVGNGIAGQAGYARSSVSGEPLLTGATTTFNYSTPNDIEDDGARPANLPFAFPFGGVSERSVSVSTNGWISFGNPAWDYWDDEQPSDYRGVNAVVGELERGIMPYWGDLDVGEPNPGDGTVKMVVPADGSSVAFQWDLGQHSSGGGVPRRVFQLVLFPDGRFRFDYPGENASGGNEAFIGYSLGTGAASVDAVGTNVEAVPSTSLLFTPNAVPTAGPLAAGQVTVALPAGSSFLSGGAGCTASVAPGAFSQGLASCPVGSLASGQQATQTVTFAMPADAPGQSRPANFRFPGTYLTSGFKLTDGDEIDALNTNLSNATIILTPKYTSPPTPEAGEPALFTAEIKSNTGGLDEPTATFTLPANATLDSIQIAGQDIDCTAPSGGQVTCRLPSGTNSTAPVVTVTPTPAAIGNPMKLVVSAQALNAPAVSGEVESPAVAP
jgi:hypothetical protein